MKNKLLTYKEEPPKDNIKKHNYIIIIITSILALLVVLLIAYFCLIYNKPSNKLKRYLQKQEYTCYKKKCIKETKQDRIEINFKNGNYMVSNNDFTLSITNSIQLENKDAYPCTYPKKTENKLSLIDSERTEDRTCRTYIDSVNDYIFDYQNMLNGAKVDVNDLSK